MRRSVKYIIGATALCLSIFFFTCESNAGTQDPPFSTSFNCSAATVKSGWSCDQYAYWGGGECYGTCTHTWVNSPSITSAANNPLGSGNGFRSWFYGDSTNTSSYDVNIVTNFNTPQKELWIRWYMRYQSGIIGTNLYYQKLLYIRTGTSSLCVIPEFYTGNQFQITIQSPAGPPYINSGQVAAANAGFSSIYPGGVSDGSWHCFEIHMKMDTNATSTTSAGNGIGEVWVDGVLKVSNTAVNYSGGDATGKQGWTWFDFPGNYSYGSSTPGLNTNGNEMYVDWDDVTVSNTGYIGPLGGTVNNAPAIPTGVTVQILP